MGLANNFIATKSEKASLIIGQNENATMAKINDIFAAAETTIVSENKRHIGIMVISCSKLWKSRRDKKNNCDKKD